jgi:hypothetical protein
MDMDFWAKRKTKQTEKKESKTAEDDSFLDRLGVLVRRRTAVLLERTRIREAGELKSIERKLVSQVETEIRRDAAVERRAETLDMAWAALELLKQNETQPKYWIDQVPQIEAKKHARKRPKIGDRIGRFVFDGWLLDETKYNELIVANDRDCPLAIVACNTEVDDTIARWLYDDLQASKEYKEYIAACESRGRAVMNRIRNERNPSFDKRPTLRRDAVAPSESKERQMHDVLRQYYDDLISITSERYVKTPLTLSNIPETTEYLAKTMKVAPEKVDEQIRLKIAELLAKNNIDV